MKKPPLYYNNQVVGYVDDIVYNDTTVEVIKFYLFYSEFYNSIVENIKKSLYSMLQDKIYDFKIEEDYLICKLIK